MGYLREALGVGIDSTTTPQEQGRQFEVVLRQALRVHPSEWGKSRFEDVWLWPDWPQRSEFGYSRGDKGIDLVALTNETWGEQKFVAIQAKYGLSDISTGQIDSFLALSDNADIFGERVLVADRCIAKNGEEKLEKANPRVQILRLNDIDGWVEDWRKYIPNQIDDLEIDFKPHDLRRYQAEALDAISKNFVDNDRGKLILPCGTGKSFIALKVAEENVGVGKTVLYLVPSISLMGQMMREWSRHRSIEHQYVGICSDVSTGKDPDGNEEGYVRGAFSELYMPVTTNLEKISDALAQPVPKEKMRVVFSTYQSTIKLVEALKSNSLRNFSFDLAICDEAHRTTGVEASAQTQKKATKRFQLIHENKNVSAKKRLYMTATPRVFAENVRRRMAEKAFDGQSYSMDDEETFGPEAYRMSFAAAIDGGWLSDYRVVVIGVSEQDYLDIAKDNPIAFEDGKLVNAETVVRLAGCWDALARPSSQDYDPNRDLGELSQTTHRHARSAIAFTSRIPHSKMAAKLWSDIARWHQNISKDSTKSYLDLTVEHLEAKTPSSDRHTLIESLRHATDDGVCKVLTNVGVLSEGVDIPALDAVVFLQSRSSPVDVTQAVGRVMRRAEGKKLGYVVIPVVVPAFQDIFANEEVSPEHLLSASDFKPVWDVVRALRSHDERIAHMLEARTMPIELRIPIKPGGTNGGNGGPVTSAAIPPDTIDKLNKHFSSVMLDVCGDRHMYPNWGEKAGVVSDQIKIRLDALIKHYPKVCREFELFHESLLVSVSPNISFEETVRMVAHHLVTVPVFEEVFSDSKFADRNPITQSMARVIATLSDVGADFDQERQPLEHAYRMMNTAFKSAEEPSRRLDVLRTIFDGFFKKAMPNEVKTMGIAYTPIELVDFMIKFVDKLCQMEFSRGLSAKEVHILDPFTGTGTFLAHLLECKNDVCEYIVNDDDLERKYEKEMHANELVLLAYYISALKIEETKHRRTMITYGEPDRYKVDYDPFEHIVLADTFHLGTTESDGTLFGDLKYNTRRAQDQLDVPIRVIIGNPPWSTGKDDAAETATKTKYKELQARITETYVREHRKIEGNTPGGSAVGNLYVSAFRWATDRISKNQDNLPSIIAFVSPNSLTDGTSLAGMRKSLRQEFSDIYVVNLRGNAYKQGEEWQKEGDKIFGKNSMNGVQITFLIKNPEKSNRGEGNLHYAMVPERLNLESKFEWLSGICDPKSESFQEVPVTASHDWINLHNPKFDNLMRVCKPNKSKQVDWVIDMHCSGIKTNLDKYMYSFSKEELCSKIKRLILEFNRCANLFMESDRSEDSLARITASSSSSLESIKWTDKLKQRLKKGVELCFDETKIREVLYRPFTKCFLYEDFDIITAGKSASALFPLENSITPPPPPPPLYKSSSQIHPTKQSTDVSRPVSDQIYARPGRYKPHEFSACDHDEQWKQHENRSLGNYSRLTTNSSVQHRAILIASPANQSLASVFCSSILCDLHLIAPGQVTRILRTRQFG